MAKTRRVAVVTGGANGLGRASAFRLAEAGRAIAIWDQDREGSVHTMNEIVACGGEAIECDVDVASDLSIAAAAKARASIRSAPALSERCAPRGIRCRSTPRVAWITRTSPPSPWPETPDLPQPDLFHQTPSG